MSNTKNSDSKIAISTSIKSIIVNLVLSLFKLFAGIFASSAAMISDAIHSASDVFSSIIVIIGVTISAKEPDEEHPYGHERFEPVYAIILADVLLITGIFIGYSAVNTLIANSYEDFKEPGILAIIAAALSIAIKEAMYWYTRYQAKKINSTALMADAWHHRSDGLSSIGALVGILFARHGLPYMDSVASLVICFFIGKAAFDISKDAINKLVDRSCGKEFENEVKLCIEVVEGVVSIDLVRSRAFANRVYVDIEIGVDRNLSLMAAHEIAENVHDKLEQDIPTIKHVTVHVNPAGHNCEMKEHAK